MKEANRFSWDKFHETPVVGIIRGMGFQDVRRIAKAYLEAGFTTLEVTMNTDAACELIRDLGQEFSQLNIGAGTVCSERDLDQALAAGAQFIVTPIVDVAVIRKCVDLEIPIFPGAYTPTEIYQAWSAGAPAVKVFPATQLGPSFIKDVLAPLDQVRLLPTGGVDIHTIRAFFEAGAVGVGMGGSLFDSQLIQKGEFEKLKEHFVAIKAAIKDFCKK
ncbi:bifunctional 4-hydroxy-2-oxoglutarate aldolase/2-dehydro-3-deoxy-phosphogluconate aldolase [Algoriphagus sp. H41]|uniref:Bifunctional 4-hydroxy-2-oxoglutarate aldolase/2-dehydro-3-deoxy-phosphogluconate aldolase n=1 Tax=Algoriphagus oliviformis TaxID=2811231 RepID=A0ABS3C8P8_9BACT|nr:bifunctional 4-hydroxy-2-oxoglutarate aldolase/2-dehydro-3-deoxy-phosphogluconate aldolase [Algoriphagus oliviformis]MBN7813347.1 bifunctional 4-hydroxy-2-oxoglutarate aldolase/2-dehydro-3-deoxy-phosphogluconate aldolase [Algoriphagus oliviformis]